MALPKYRDPEEVQRLVDEYFTMCDENKRPYTITGLGMVLDTTRDILLNYENEVHASLDEEKAKQISNTIKKAKKKIHNYAEEYLFQGKNQIGCIFNLKNNWSWADKQEIITTTKYDMSGLTKEELESELNKIKK